MEKVILYGRGAIPGIAEGEALVCPHSIAGWGGVDPKTGEIKEWDNPNRGATIKDAILVLPGSKGSNGWSCYFGAARAAGCAPRGWIFTQIDSSSGVASAVMGIPTVVDFSPEEDPCRWIENGDYVRIDGSTGTVEVTKKRNKSL